MTLLDYLLIAGIVLAVGLALRTWIRNRKKGKCCGDCSNCGGSCGK